MNVIRKVTTNEGGFGESKTLAGIEYPHGGRPPTAIPLAINRDVKYSDFQIDKASSYVYSIHGWDKQLNGFEPARSNIGGNIIIDLFITKNTGTILPLQNDWCEIWAEILVEIAGQTEYQGQVYTLKFPNLIDELVEQLIASKHGKTDEILEAEEEEAIEEIEDTVETQQATIEELQNKINELSQTLSNVQHTLNAR